MVLITNGIDTFEVSKGAFTGIFAKQGYRLVEPEVAADTAEEEVAMDDDTNHVKEAADEEAMSEDEKFCKTLLEKPIAQWTKAEVKRFADVKEIDISGTQGPAEAKEVIKAALDM